MPAARRKSAAAPRSSLLVLAGLVLLTAAAVWWLRRRQSAAGIDLGQSPSVRPAVDSSAQQPSGGASSIPGQLPGDSVSEPATVSDQVQGATAVPTTSEAPNMVALTTPSLTPTGYGFVTTPHEYGTTTVYGPGGPVLDTDYVASSPHPTVTPTITHPVGGGPQL